MRLAFMGFKAVAVAFALVRASINGNGKTDHSIDLRSAACFAQPALDAALCELWQQHRGIQFLTSARTQPCSFVQDRFSMALKREIGALTGSLHVGSLRRLPGFVLRLERVRSVQ